MARGWATAHGREERRRTIHVGPNAALEPGLCYIYVVHASAPSAVAPSQEECCIAANEPQFDIGVIKDDKFFIKSATPMLLAPHAAPPCPYLPALPLPPLSPPPPCCCTFLCALPPVAPPHAHLPPPTTTHRAHTFALTLSSDDTTPTSTLLLVPAPTAAPTP